MAAANAAVPAVRTKSRRRMRMAEVSFRAGDLAAASIPRLNFLDCALPRSRSKIRAYSSLLLRRATSARYTIAATPNPTNHA